MKTRFFFLSLPALAFVMTGLFLLTGLTNSTLIASTKPASGSMKIHYQSLKGEISAVDMQNHSLTIKEGQESKTLSFDNKTKIFESGHIVQSSALAAGEKTTIRYKDENGKMEAERIYLRKSHQASANSKTKKM